MRVLKAHVKDGRLVLDEPTELPEGAEVELVAVEVPFDDAAAGEAAAVYRDLAKAGQVIGKADLYIAGICLASDAKLITRNVREYGRVDGLQLARL